MPLYITYFCCCYPPQRETAERLEVLRRADRYEHALGVKDHMLWVAMQVSYSREYFTRKSYLHVRARARPRRALP